MRSPRVIVIDRSALAVNMFRLLGTPLGVKIVAAKRCDEARTLLQRETCALMIINSNTFGKRFNEYLAWWCDDGAVAPLPKIFLCREGKGEASWREVLAGVPRAQVMIRPFDPQEFVRLLQPILVKERKS